MLNSIWWSYREWSKHKRQKNKQHVWWNMGIFPLHWRGGCKRSKFSSFTHITAYASTKKTRTISYLTCFVQNYTLTFKFHVIQCAFSFGVLTPICVHSISFFSLIWFSCVVNGDECFCSTFPNPKSVSNQETERHTNTSTHARQRREQKNDSSQYANRSCSHTHTAAHLKCLVSLLTMIHFAMGLPFRCFRLPVLCFFLFIFKP